MWLTKLFVAKAQTSWLAHVIPKDKIPMSLQLAELGRDAVIRITNGQGEELEISGVDIGELHLYVDTARTYMRQAGQSMGGKCQSYDPTLTDAVRSDRLSAPSPGVHPSPNNHTPSRDSLTSITADTPGLAEGLRPKSRKKTRPTPTAWPRTYPKKPYLCPTCGTQLTQASDFKKHIHQQCERQCKHYKCGDCNYISEDQSKIELHFTTTRHAGLLVLPTIDKKAFGCPYCAKCLHSLEDYFQCMRKHQETSDNLLRPTPRPTLRLRGLLRQSDTTTRSMSVACTKHGLHATEWTRMMWDDADCDAFSTKLEYGCNASDDIHGWGVWNLDDFVEQVLSCARFEDTGKPVPPLKDTTPGPSSNGPMYAAFMPTPCDSRAGDYQFDFADYSGGAGVLDQSGISYPF